MSAAATGRDKDKIHKEVTTLERVTCMIKCILDYHEVDRTEAFKVLLDRFNKLIKLMPEDFLKTALPYRM